MIRLGRPLVVLLVAALGCRGAVLNCSDVSAADWQAAVSGTGYDTAYTRDCWSAEHLGSVCTAYAPFAALCPATCGTCVRTIDFGLPNTAVPPWTDYFPNATGADKWGMNSLIYSLMGPICNEVANLTW